MTDPTLSWRDPDMPCLVYCKNRKRMEEVPPGEIQRTAARVMTTQLRGVVHWRKDPTYSLRRRAAKRPPQAPREPPL